MEEKENNLKYCDICKSQATSLCPSCLSGVGFYYCDSCYKMIHDKKENMNHKKEKIDYYLPIDLRCNIHQNVSLNLFCLDEKGNILFYLIFNIYRTLLFNVLFFKYS